MYIDQPKSGFHDWSGYLNDHCHPWMRIRNRHFWSRFWSVWHGWHQNKTPNSNGLESHEIPIFHLAINWDQSPISGEFHIHTVNHIPLIYPTSSPVYHHRHFISMKWLVLYIEWGFPVGFIKGNHLVFFHIARENGPLSSMIYLSNMLFFSYI
jgi:hypothetical protein